MSADPAQPPGSKLEARPEDSIPDLPGNERAREFLSSAPSKGLWMPLGQEVKVMQCWRCKANGHTNGGYGHRTGDRECPFFLSGNIQSENLRKRIEDPMAGQLSSDKAKPQLGSAEEVQALLVQIKEVEELKKRQKKRKREKKKKKKKKKHKNKKEKKHKKHKKASSSSSGSSGSGSGGGGGSSSSSRGSNSSNSSNREDAPNPDNPRVTFYTGEGIVEAEIFLDQAPLTASNFLELCASGHYDGLHIHRVLRGFAIQFGCHFSRDLESMLRVEKHIGDGAPAAGSRFKLLGGAREGEWVTRDERQGTIVDEHSSELSNRLGTLAMANQNNRPDSAGSQFIFNLANNSCLDWFNKETKSNHVVFGKVRAGLHIITENIAEGKTDASDAPVRPLCVERVKVTSHGSNPRVAAALADAAAAAATAASSTSSTNKVQYRSMDERIYG